MVSVDRKRLRDPRETGVWEFRESRKESGESQCNSTGHSPCGSTHDEAQWGGELFTLGVEQREQSEGGRKKNG